MCYLMRGVFTFFPILFLTIILALPALAAPRPMKNGSNPRFDQPFTAIVTRIHDGDTITVSTGDDPKTGTRVKIRLVGIDAPESRQDFGQKAKKYVSQVALRKVKVVPHGYDRYNRLLGEVVLGNGLNLNQLIVKEGFAWWYRQYSDDQELRRLEEEARQARRGLWADKSPEPPWDWRKRQAVPTVMRAIKSGGLDPTKLEPFLLTTEEREELKKIPPTANLPPPPEHR